MNAENAVSGRALPHIQSLSAYVPGFQPEGSDWIKLNTNENPYPPSPKVLEAIRLSASDNLRLYPDPTSAALRKAVAELHELQAENVIVGNGSDDALNLLVRAFSGGERTATYLNPSYSLYPVLCGIQNAQVVEIPFTSSLEIPFQDISKLDAEILFFTSPNAPTGAGFSNEAIRELLSTFDGIVVVDEAYADFAKTNAVNLLGEHPNLVVTRSLSKSYSLAGLRVGYALASREIIEALDRVRDSYNVNRLSQAGGIAAIRDQSYMNAIVNKIIRTRDFYIEEFRSLGWRVYDSQANMIFTSPRDGRGNEGPEIANRLFEYLKANRILVRYFPGHVLTERFLRISVGDEEQMLKLNGTIEKWLKTE